MNEWSEGNDCGDYSLLDRDAAQFRSQILYIYLPYYMASSTKRLQAWKDLRFPHWFCWEFNVFWYVTLCRSVSVSPTFQRNVLPPSPRVKHFQSSPWTPWLLKIKPLCSFKTSGNNDPATQRHISEDVNPQQVTFCRIALKLIKWQNHIQVMWFTLVKSLNHPTYPSC